VLLIAGCTPMFNGPIKGKQISENKVQVKFKVCQRDNATGECEAPEARSSRGETTYYHLLGFRVPKGTKAPDAFSSKLNNLGYERSGSYARELKDLAPTPEGTKWFGFVSEGLAGDELQPRDRYKVKFKLPDDPGDVFKYRPVTGFTAASAPGDPPPVECGDDLFEPSKESNPNASCSTDPTKRRKIRRSKRIPLD
jgi:hypothetical protein